jgi:hypothetical protein
MVNFKVFIAIVTVLLASLYVYTNYIGPNFVEPKISASIPWYLSWVPQFNTIIDGFNSALAYLFAIAVLLIAYLMFFRRQK